MEITALSNLKIYSEKIAKELLEKTRKLNIKEVKGNGEFEVVATTDGVDRDGEIISVEGWQFENFMKNPIMLWGHDYWQLSSIMGAVTEVKIEDHKVIVKGVFANTPTGQLAKQLYDDGILKTVSVGFIPLERNGNVITKAELLEVSFVSVPANPDAVSLAKMVKLSNMIKTAVPHMDMPVADEATEWDEAKAVERLKDFATSKNDDGAEVVDYNKYAMGFAWYDTETPSDESTFALPHKDIIDGEMKVVWLGVAAAMAELLKEDSVIPEADKQAVYDSLKMYYALFDKEVPELESQDNPNSADDADEEEKAIKVKAGRVLSAKNRELIKGCMDSLTSTAKLLGELYDATEVDKSSQPELAKEVRLSAQQLQKICESVIKKSKELEKTN